MQTHILVFSTVLLALFQTACKKDKDFADPGTYIQKYDSLGLPIIEPQYPNKAAFGCMINGQLWIPEGGNWLEGPFSCDVFARTEPDSGSAGQLQATLETLTKHQFLNISLPINGYQLGNFGLADWRPGIGQFGFDAYFINYGSNQPSYICALRDTANSRLSITHFDFEKGYIAGTFQMTMYRELEGMPINPTLAERDAFIDFTDSLVITNGRFGMKYRRN